MGSAFCAVYNLFKHKDGRVQNRTNWCWAVARRMVGERFKRNHPEFDFSFHYAEKGMGKLTGEMRKKRELEPMTGNDCLFGTFLLGMSLL